MAKPTRQHTNPMVSTAISKISSVDNEMLGTLSVAVGAEASIVVSTLSLFPSTDPVCWEILNMATKSRVGYTAM